jgi:NAD(P)H-hydrate epimerase
MMDLLESKRIDLNYQFNHGDMFPLMENAGLVVSKVIGENYGTMKKILVICGSGNNGGDGIVAARNLSKDNEVSIILYTKKDGSISKLSELALKTLKNISVIKNPEIKPVEEQINKNDIIVDSVFGTGVRDPIPEPLITLFKIINKSKKKIVSVDVPSGMGASNAILPTLTVTFTDKKKGANKNNSGTIVVKDIGIEKEVIDYTGAGDMIYFPSIKKSGHKGENGKLLIIAGWKYTGAGCMAAKSSENSLVDLVNILVPEEKYGIFSTKLDDQVVSIYSDKELKEQIEKSTAVMVGCGMGMEEKVVNCVLKVAEYSKRIVFDADAIHIMSKHKSLINSNMIFTPHGEEFRSLTSKEPTRENAEQFCKEYGCTILLKGPIDTITNGKNTLLSSGGSPRMAMGGTGDVLAGLTAGLLARGMEPFRAASLASYINKKSGEEAEKNSIYWYNTNKIITNARSIMKNLFEFCGMT